MTASMKNGISVGEELRGFMNRIKVSDTSSQKKKAPQAPVDALKSKASQGDIVLTKISRVSLEQKIRRAFVSNGPFNYDAGRCDIEIRHEDNAFSIFLDVSKSRDAKEKAASIWEDFHERFFDVDWEKDSEGIIQLDSEGKVQIIFVSEKLTKPLARNKIVSI